MIVMKLWFVNLPFKTQADMLHDFFTIEQVAENTFSNQQMVNLNQMKWVAENAMQWKRSLLISDSICRTSKS